MTALVNERFRAQINDIVLDPATPDLFTVRAVHPAGRGRLVHPRGGPVDG